MLKNRLFLYICLFMIFSAYAAQAEEITNRETRPNSVTLGADFGFLTFSPLTGAPLLSLDYNRMINKNFSVGINVKTIVLINSINLSGRYYFNLIDSKSSEVYIQTDIGYNTIPSSSTNPESTKSSSNVFISLNPTIGYEFRADNGFTFNVDAGPYFSYGSGIMILPVKAGVKLGYSF